MAGDQAVQFTGGPRYYAGHFDNGPKGWGFRFIVTLLCYGSETADARVERPRPEAQGRATSVMIGATPAPAAEAGAPRARLRAEPTAACPGESASRVVS